MSQENWKTLVDDTLVCPPQQLTEKEERHKAEEQRLNRAVHNVETEPEGPRNELLIYLEGLPARAGAPVTITVKGDVYYSSGSLEGNVQDVVIKVPNLKENAVVPLILKIACKKFEQCLDVNLAEGTHLKLSIESGKGFQIKQQTKSFSYVPGKLNTKEVVPALQAKKEKVPSLPRSTSGGLYRTSGSLPTTTEPAITTTTSHDSHPVQIAPTQHAAPSHQSAAVSTPVREELAGNEAAYAAEEEARLAKSLGKRGYGYLTKG